MLAFLRRDAHFPTIGEFSQQGNTTMTKTLTLTASMMLLLVISGHASARARYLPVATGRADQQQAVRAFNAFYPAMAMQTVEPNAHRYHGGPKSND